MYILNTLYSSFLLFVLIWTGIIDTNAQLNQNLTEDPYYNRQLDRAIECQRKADSFYHLSVEWRKMASRMDDPLERGRLQGRIVIIEDSMQVYRERADHHFAALDHPRSPFIILDTVLHGIRLYHYNMSDEFLVKLQEIEEGVDMAEFSTQADSGLGIEFEIYTSSPYNADREFENDFVPPRGTFYRIQLGVYSKKIAADHFGGLFPITTEKISEKGLTRYFAGKFTRLDNARTALLKVRSSGFPDAFIIGYFNGVKGTPDKLRALEKEL